MDPTTAHFIKTNLNLKSRQHRPYHSHKFCILGDSGLVVNKPVTGINTSMRLVIDKPLTRGEYSTLNEPPVRRGS